MPREVAVWNLSGYIAQYSNFIVLDSKIKEGLAPFRNEGLGCSKGDVVFFFDGDDYLATVALQKLWMYAIEDQSDIESCVGILKWITGESCCTG